jgi:hypothetical protein
MRPIPTLPDTVDLPVSTAGIDRRTLYASTLGIEASVKSGAKRLGPGHRREPSGLNQAFGALEYSQVERTGLNRGRAQRHQRQVSPD